MASPQTQQQQSLEAELPQWTESSAGTDSEPQTSTRTDHRGRSVGRHHLVEDLRRSLYSHDEAHVRYNPYPQTPSSHRYLDAFGSTDVIQALSRNFPLAIAISAEPIQQSKLATLSVRTITEMLKAEGVSRAARRRELTTMKIQIAEKQRQIALLKSLVHSQESCIQLADVHFGQLEKHARQRDIDVDACIHEDEESVNRYLEGVEPQSPAHDSEESEDDEEGERSSDGLDMSSSDTAVMVDGFGGYEAVKKA
ncbi:uncharacterized protein B0H18DRAFT_1121701 [Fomitopsis serialis]|uniref:uncharacterized protein n=1 Tax=Fomitopsis serialis TaxID=139415 RepID=UPI002007DCB4|nr:uncharacterized protein B0H18DRAFT_1121701 [Neoantrodia serialis]KAH9920740.1 hypothetical protein B0H18DRAFT_1121701 [Neoantrodia serialis]